MTSTPSLKHLESFLRYTFASDPYTFWGAWTSEKDMNMISVEMYTHRVGQGKREGEKEVEGKEGGSREEQRDRQTERNRHIQREVAYNSRNFQDLIM